jgi:aminoglycoside phosphotransferase family enzyme
MAPEVYLGVSEVRRSRGRYRMDGPGETVEYAVRMRQLPRERAMDQLLRRGQVSSQDIRRLAAKIARFHAGAAAGPEITRLGGLDTVRRNIEDNFAQIRRFVGLCLTQEAIQALGDYSRDFMAERREVFQRRAAEGRIRDCHGDLHTAQIFLLEPGRAAAADGSDGISIIDCIEFNDRFRYCDVAEDIAFLAMDLDYHGRPDLSAQFVREYVAVTEDPGVLELLDFFKVYRACIRGKVTAFRLEMPAGAPEVQPEKRSISPEQGRLLAAAQGYFALALGYVRQAAPPPSGQLLPPDRP